MPGPGLAGSMLPPGGAASPLGFSPDSFPSGTHSANSRKDSCWSVRRAHVQLTQGAWTLAFHWGLALDAAAAAVSGGKPGRVLCMQRGRRGRISPIKKPCSVQQTLLSGAARGVTKPRLPRKDCLPASPRECACRGPPLSTVHGTGMLGHTPPTPVCPQKAGAPPSPPHQGQGSGQRARGGKATAAHHARAAVTGLPAEATTDRRSRVCSSYGGRPCWGKVGESSCAHIELHPKHRANPRGWLRGNMGAPQGCGVFRSGLRPGETAPGGHPPASAQPKVTGSFRLPPGGLRQAC